MSTDRENFLNELQSTNNSQNPIFNLIDTYSNFTKPFNIEYFKYIVAGAYLDYKELYPNLDIFILWRVKSNYSFEKNIGKTAAKTRYTRRAFKRIF